MMWVKGFARVAGALGEELTIETITGRKVDGLTLGREPRLLPSPTATRSRS